MSELIDRSTLGREIPLKVCLPCPMGEDFECKDCPLDKAMEMIEAAPTIEAVPVVRCKDCRHRIMTEYAAKYDPEYYCELDTDDIYELGRKADDPNWFCADGQGSTENGGKDNATIKCALRLP